MKVKQIDPWEWFLFKEHVMHKSRYQLTDRLNKFVHNIGQLSIGQQRTFKKGRTFFRARIGPSRTIRNINPKNRKTLMPIEAYKGKDMQAPPPEKNRSGRANARGIRCLYLADSTVSAIAEVRPWKGALVSIVEYELTKDIRIVDLRNSSSPSIPLIWALMSNVANEGKLIEYMWAEISQEFAIPISPEDSDWDYVPTQFLAETFIKFGGGGIAYRSAMSDTRGFNLALFDEKLVKQHPQNAVLKDIRGVKYNCTNYEDPTKRRIRMAFEGM